MKPRNVFIVDKSVSRDASDDEMWSGWAVLW